MEKSQKNQIKHDALHYMLQMALIEIRASDSLAAARKFADIFHNLPMRLLKCSSGEDYDAELKTLLERARRWGLDGYLQGLWETAVRAVTPNS